MLRQVTMGAPAAGVRVGQTLALLHAGEVPAGYGAGWESHAVTGRGSASRAGRSPVFLE